MLLSKFLLQFLDDELKSGYRVEQRSRYGVVTIIMTVLLALLGTATEVIFRLELFEEKDLGVLSLPTSIANWVAVAIMIVLAILVRKRSMAHWAVCPLLTMCSRRKLISYEKSFNG